MTRKFSIVAFIALAALPLSAAASGARPLDFDRDVRPILSENCFLCHGFDSSRRQAGLRLDTPEGAFQRLATGDRAIVPGDTETSALVHRITAAAAMRMPPDGSGKSLTADQIETLKQWIAQGARYAKHWAFVAPRRPPLPRVVAAAWVRNPIDRFVLAKLEADGLKPSREADRGTLLRRVTFDLTGLPPTPAELNAFLADRRPDAYEHVVDRLLASPRYGERMTCAWLDLARYADTHGYHVDPGRTMWPWRDWVIRAYNENMPYDRFVIDQLAGDLLPHATQDDRVASGFNRNHPITLEGGAIPEEYAAAYIFDRIDTTATTFMGLTMRCAQCHDHKYDPISQKEFYRFYAFFNNVPENGLDGFKGNAVPFMKAPTPDQKRLLDWYDLKLAVFERQVKAEALAAAPRLPEWERGLAAGGASSPETGLLADYRLAENGGSDIRDAAGKAPAGRLQGKARWSAGPAGSALGLDGGGYAELGPYPDFDRTDHFSYGAWIYPTTGDGMAVLSRMDDDASYRGWDLFLSGGKVFVHLIHAWEKNAIRVNTKDAIELNKWHHVFVTYDGSSKASGITVYVDGKPASLDVTHDTLTDTIRTSKPFRIGSRNPGSMFHGSIADVRIYDRVLTPSQVQHLAGRTTALQALAIASAKRTPQQRDTLSQYLLEEYDPDYQLLVADRLEMQKKHDALDDSIPTTMVMEEMPKPRDTFVLLRGQYDKHGEKVTPGVPSCLPPLPAGAPANRLTLARWIASPGHPLTARVAVNRYWQRYFGLGLVATLENFGIQGDRPSNPALLDWLATEFVRTGWNVKAMQRLIVTSATYRQSSRVTRELLARDPENRLLARGPRFRLPAEMIRDQALAISGLLVEKLGGPSVKPYQPAGLWAEISFGGGFSEQVYVQQHGDDLYRRSMYTFWKRTVPPPALQTFDAPEREFCMPRRSITNTPLQALVLENDPTYVEASRKLAERVMASGSAPQKRLDAAYRLAICRTPRPQEAKVMLGLYNAELATFRKDPKAAVKLLTVGESKRNEKLDPAELAAWTTVASVILNLDETITKS